MATKKTNDLKDGLTRTDRQKILDHHWDEFKEWFAREGDPHIRIKLGQVAPARLRDGTVEEVSAYVMNQVFWDWYHTWRHIDSAAPPN
jgi:hypothetical protein